MLSSCSTYFSNSQAYRRIDFKQYNNRLKDRNTHNTPTIAHYFIAQAENGNRQDRISPIHYTMLSFSFSFRINGINSPCICCLPILSLLLFPWRLINQQIFSAKLYFTRYRCDVSKANELLVCGVGWKCIFLATIY